MLHYWNSSKSIISTAVLTCEHSFTSLKNADLEFTQICYHSNSCFVGESPRQSGNLTGSTNGLLVFSPIIALAKVYPKAVDTANETAFPTCKYLKPKSKTNAH